LKEEGAAVMLSAPDRIDYLSKHGIPVQADIGIQTADDSTR
jgi:hypothetical protein